MRGQRKSGAQRVERAQNAQSFFRSGCQLHAGLRGQIGIGTGFGTSDTSTNLIELRQAKHIRAVHHHGVRRRNIQPAFHNRGGQKHIEFAVIKRVHAVIQLARGHLAMRGDKGHFRHLFVQELFDFTQIGNAWHDIERLPSAIMFAQQGLADGDRIKFAHISPDRQPVHRRSANN